MALPSDREHVVLQTVWKLGPCTVRQVFEAVGEPQGLAYTTIATVLDRLHGKGLVVREREGMAHVYRPAKRRGAVERARAKSLVARILGPDPLPAVTTLVDAVEAIDPDLLGRLAEEIEARRRSRRGS